MEHTDQGPGSTFLVVSTSEGCRISRGWRRGYVVTHALCPGTELTAPNLPTAFAQCQQLQKQPDRPGTET